MEEFNMNHPDQQRVVDELLAQGQEGCNQVGGWRLEFDGGHELLGIGAKGNT